MQLLHSGSDLIMKHACRRVAPCLLAVFPHEPIYYQTSRIIRILVHTAFSDVRTVVALSWQYWKVVTARIAALAVHIILPSPRSLDVFNCIRNAQYGSEPSIVSTSQSVVLPVQNRQ